MEKAFILDDYFGEEKDPQSLINYVCRPVFLKTKIDVLYFDILNWEKHGLLEIDFGIEPDDKDYKKTAISFVGYIWIKIVEALVKYGFLYKDILMIKKRMAEKLHFQSVYNLYIANDEQIKSKYDESVLQKAEQVAQKSSDSYITYLEQLVFSTIRDRKQYKIFFYKSAPSNFFLFSGDIIKLFTENDMNHDLQHHFDLNHFSFSFSKLFEPFINDKTNAFEQQNVTILTKEEDKVLKMIRRDYNNLKTITIRYKDSIATMMEITTTKKVEAESRIIDHIQKNDYSTIEIKTVDGQVAYFENTKKHKL